MRTVKQVSSSGFRLLAGREETGDGGPDACLAGQPAAPGADGRRRAILALPARRGRGGCRSPTSPAGTGPPSCCSSIARHPRQEKAPRPSTWSASAPTAARTGCAYGRRPRTIPVTPGSSGGWPSTGTRSSADPRAGSTGARRAADPSSCRRRNVSTQGCRRRHDTGVILYAVEIEAPPLRETAADPPGRGHPARRVVRPRRRPAAPGPRWLRGAHHGGSSRAGDVPGGHRSGPARRGQPAHGPGACRGRWR